LLQIYNDAIIGDIDEIETQTVLSFADNLIIIMIRLKGVWSKTLTGFIRPILGCVPLYIDAISIFRFQTLR